MSNAAVSVYALASGSSGNATLICTKETNILIDCGLGIRKLSSLLHGKGVLANNLHGILVTHEHIDHIAGLGNLCRRTGAPVFTNDATHQACSLLDPLVNNQVSVPTGSELRIGQLTVRSFAVPHDASEPVGWVVQHEDWRMCYFTDAGIVTDAMKSGLCGADLAIVEANHDVEMLRRGPYTSDMKARVASSTGHLSNTQCADALAAKVEDEGPATIWLAHLSRVNNSPAVARNTVMQGIKSRTKTTFSLEVAHRDSPSATYHRGMRAVQLSLF